MRDEYSSEFLSSKEYASGFLTKDEISHLKETLRSISDMEATLELVKTLKPEVRIALAKETTDPDMMYLLLNDPDEGVRGCLNNNEVLPMELDRLLSDSVGEGTLLNDSQMATARTVLDKMKANQNSVGAEHEF